jgi:hypothetical protein
MVTQRGTSNTNARGSVEDRRKRREWLIATFRANVDVASTLLGFVTWHPACRCYRCGVLLTVDTVTVDRIIPGCHGGTYRRNNIRPACGTCNSETGATMRRKGAR